MREEIKIVDIESLMPKEHLLRKIDTVILYADFNYSPAAPLTYPSFLILVSSEKL